MSVFSSLFPKDSKQEDSSVPSLIVFDCDQCLWSPEMFEIPGHPFTYDEESNTVYSGDEPVRIYPGALEAIRKIRSDPKFANTRIAVASSTHYPEHSKECFELFQVFNGEKLGDCIDYKEVYPGRKTTHFQRLKENSNLEYHDMLFFDDCTWSDNCATVRNGCPGVTCVATPDGLTQEKFELGLREYAENNASKY